MRIRLAEPMTAADLPELAYLSPDTASIPFFGIATDSREIKEGDLFLAFRGRHTDGSDFISEAFERGAVLAVSETQSGKRTIYCRNLIKLLYRLAEIKLSELSPEVIAVTGSVGKSSFIAYAASILRHKGSVHLASGNYNTDIGVPLTILSMPPNTDYLLLELGARQIGDVGRLSLLAKPQIAVITCIGHSHLETFGSLSGVLRAKSEILIGLRPGGTLIYNADDPLLSSWVKELSCDTIGVSTNPRSSDAETTVTPESNEIEFDVGGCRISGIELKNRGQGAVLAAALSTALAIKLGVETEKIKEALKECKSPPMRQEFIYKNGILYIMDAYNASPESSKAALDLLAETKIEGRRFALLGDMLELGSDSSELHYQLGVYAAKKKLDKLYCIGELSKQTRLGAISASMPKQNIHAFDISQKKELTNALLHEIKRGDVLLLKASRAFRLESILTDLTQR